MSDKKTKLFLKEQGYTVKEEVKGFTGLYEACDPLGTSVVIRTKKFIPAKRVAKDELIVAQDIPVHAHLAQSNTGTLTGFVIHTKGHTYYNHGECSMKVSHDDDNSLLVDRILPVITTNELKQDRKATILNSDLANTGIMNDLTVRIISLAEDFDATHEAISTNAEKYFSANDEILSEIIKSTRVLRDKLALLIREDKGSTEEASSIRMKLQSRSAIINNIHTHMTQINEYTVILKAASNKIASMGVDINSLYLDMN